MQPAHPRVALVTCDALPQLYEDDRLLVPALEQLGIASVPAIWSDPAVDWTSFAALVIRTPWDYFQRSTEFLAWLDARIASRVLLCNAGDILAWNYDKRYLQDLAAAGMSLVPTICIPRGESVDEILADRGVLLQPFLPEILTGGELSLLFFDGIFSHAVCKRPAPGDYRVQFQYGGTNETVDVDPALVAQARACVLAAPSLPVYARVDGLVKGGQFLLMELEVFEPLMFLARHPDAPSRFARAIHARLLAHTGA
jgi:hypothetical protein